MNIIENDVVAYETTDGATASILGPNTLTGAGVIGVGTTCVASTMLLSTAMPVQVIGSLALAGGCYAAGVLKDNGKLPFIGKDKESTTDTPAAAPAAATPAPAAPAAEPAPATA